MRDVVQTLTLHRAGCSFAGCHYVYLPAYSPDYNPIEKCFGKMKAYIQRKGRTGYLPDLIREALSTITPKDVESFFRYSNYLT